MTTPPTEPRDHVPGLPPPGWLRDPNRADLERYWNGWDWTGLTRDRVTESGFPPVMTSTDPVSRRPPLIRGWIVALGFATAGVVGAAAYTGFLPAWVPQPAATDLGATSGPEVAYPVFGSDDTVTYLARGLVAQQESIDVTWLASGGTDVVAEVDDAMEEAQAQNPYAFVSGWRVRVSPLRTQVLPDYIYPNDEAEQRRVEIARAVAGILANPALNALTDPRETVGALHDAVLRAATYDGGASAAIDAGDRPETSALVAQSQEAYGIFVAGSAVCNGYAQAFQLLAEGSGIASVVVTGDANGGVTTGAHAWNRVLIDGEWLVVDTTWDDADDARPSRDFLLVAATDPLLRTRAANDYWVVDANVGMFQ